MAITLKGRSIDQTVMITDRKFKDDLTIDQLIDYHKDFMRDKTLEGLSPRTLRDHEVYFGYFTKWIEDSYRSTENRYVCKMLFLAYKEYMISEKGLAPCTVNIRARVIKTYLNWLHRNDLTSKSYSPYLKIIKVSDDRIHPLSKKNVKLLLNTIGVSTYARLRDYTICITILDCGIRIGELLSIRNSDIDFRNLVIRIRADISKTRSERTVPISSHTAKFLTELCSISEEYNQITPFLSTTGQSAILDNDIRINFRRYKAEAGIMVKCTPYVLRHTFATEMVKQGMDIFTLQRIMGHNNITTTRQYIQIDDRTMMQKHKESDILNQFLT